MEIVYKKAGEIKESAYNPREITDSEFEKLKSSLSEFGFVEPIVINNDNEIIGGHMRLKAGLAIGMTDFPCVVVDVTDEKAKLLNLALNRISGRWDVQKLGELITSLADSKFSLGLSGFDDWELDYYNLGNKPLGEGLSAEGIAGVNPNESFVMYFTFDNQKDFEYCSKYFNDGKAIKSATGEKLKEAVRQLSE